MKKINFEDGQLVTAGYVEIDGVQHNITEAVYEGETPLSSFNLNKMQDNIEEAINEKADTTPATQEADGLMSKDDKVKLDGLTEEAIKAIILATKPVGSIEVNTSGINPSEYIGGTWEQIKGRFLLGCGSNGVDLSTEAGDVGGEANHTLTINEMPSHEHDIIYGANNKYVQFNTGSDQYKLTWTTDGEARYGAELKAKAVGGNQPHNNLPPYLSVYMWKRTA